MRSGALLHRLLLRELLLAAVRTALLRHLLLRVTLLLHPRLLLLLLDELLLPAVRAALLLRVALLHPRLLLLLLLLDELLLSVVRTALLLRVPLLLLLLDELLLPAVRAVLLRVPRLLLLLHVLLSVRVLGLELFPGVPRLVALGAVAPALISHRSPLPHPGCPSNRRATRSTWWETLPYRSVAKWPDHGLFTAHGDGESEGWGEECWAR
ncbi:hypothetical protein GCM10009759_18570 [Kitasatospora saccharophila]|uniref:Secreted protein n=1 Tax=Kitasatospora saccharophila TaxID=407973 RepID=A0ABN2WKB2_9ACTN